MQSGHSAPGYMDSNMFLTWVDVVVKISAIGLDDCSDICNDVKSNFTSKKYQRNNDHMPTSSAMIHR